MPAAFLFDLDMTLVNSACVEALRDARMWKDVLANCHRITPFVPLVGCCPHELPAQLRAGGHKVGIVTSSVRSYAEAVVKQFRIPHDTLVAYEDTAQHKPDPEPLVLALKKLGVAAKNAVYVGDSPTDFEAAYHAGIWSVGVAWANPDWSRIGPNAPDMLVHTPKLLLDVDRLRRRGFYGDVSFGSGDPLWHKGSLLRFNGMLSGYALGRYFSASDPRHGDGGLSAAILSLKNQDDHSDQFAQILCQAVTKHEVLNQFDGIVAVPPKPAKPRDRFQSILRNVKRLEGKKLAVHADGLQCIRDYGDLKMMKPLERMEAVKGAFRTGYTWGGMRLLLLDDVMTTGATTHECIRVLKKDGAGEVMVLTIGKDQVTLERKICECGRPMKVRTNRQGVRFWGCSGYPDECRRTADYVKRSQ